MDCLKLNAPNHGRPGKTITGAAVDDAGRQALAAVPVAAVAEAEKGIDCGKVMGRSKGLH